MIFVTGASGNIGREVVRELEARHIDFCVGTRRGDVASADPRRRPRRDALRWSL